MKPALAALAFGCALSISFSAAGDAPEDIVTTIKELTVDRGPSLPELRLDVSETGSPSDSKAVFNYMKLRPITKLKETLYFGTPEWDYDREYYFLPDETGGAGVFTTRSRADAERDGQVLQIFVHIPASLSLDGTPAFTFERLTQPQIRGSVDLGAPIRLAALRVRIEGLVGDRSTVFAYEPDSSGVVEDGKLCGSYWLNVPWAQLGLSPGESDEALMLVLQEDDACLEIATRAPVLVDGVPNHVSVLRVEGLDGRRIAGARIGRSALDDLSKRIGALRDQSGFWQGPRGLLYVALAFEHYEELEARLELDLDGCKAPVSVTAPLQTFATGRSAERDIFDISAESAEMSSCDPYRRIEFQVSDVPRDGMVGLAKNVDFGEAPSDPVFLGDCQGRAEEDVFCADERELHTQIAFTRPGFDSKFERLEALLPEQPQDTVKIVFPDLELSPRRLTLDLRGLEDALPEVSIGGVPLEVAEREGTQLHFRIEDLERATTNRVEVRAPAGWRLRETSYGTPQDTHRIYVSLGNLPEWAVSRFAAHARLYMEPAEVSLAGRTLRLETRLDGALERTAYECRPGLALPGQPPTWLEPAEDGGWEVPSNFPALAPEADLAVWADGGSEKRPECPNGTAPVKQILASAVTDGGVLELPVARPLLIYVLRSRALDQRLGRQAARDYWLEMFDLAAEAAEDRVRVVRFMVEGAAFRSLRAPSQFTGLPAVEQEALLRETGDSAVPSLEAVMEDAVAQMRAYGRDGAEHAADVLVLTAGGEACADLGRAAARLRDAGPHFGYSLVVLADSNFADVGFDSEDTAEAKPVGTRCAGLPEDTAIVLTDVAGALRDGYPPYPLEAWRDALNVFRGP